jgi:hypothetical protein
MRSRSDSPTADLANPYLHPIFDEDEEDWSRWACFGREEYDLEGRMPEELRRMPEVRVGMLSLMATPETSIRHAD